MNGKEFDVRKAVMNATPSMLLELLNVTEVANVDTRRAQPAGARDYESRKRNREEDYYPEVPYLFS